MRPPSIVASVVGDEPRRHFRLLGEVRQSAFYHDDIELDEAFAPRSRTAILAKTLLGGLVTATLIVSWSTTDYPGFFLAYLTSWALLVAVFYLWLSLTHSAMGLLWLRTTWVSFTVAIHTQVLVAILYWYWVYPGDYVDFERIMQHGGVAFVLMIEGFGINQIPLRWKQWLYFGVPFQFLFVVWTMIHDYSGIGNPMDRDAETLYPELLDWSDNFVKAFFLSMFVILVLGPILFFFLWLLSIYPICCRFCRLRRRGALPTTVTTENVPLDEEEEAVVLERDDHEGPPHLVLSLEPPPTTRSREGRRAWEGPN